MNEEPAVDDIEEWLEKLKDQDEDWRVRCLAAEALGTLGDPRAIEPLIEALTDEYWDVGSSAAEALWKLGESAVEPLIGALKKEQKEDVRFAIERTLKDIQNKQD